MRANQTVEKFRTALLHLAAATADAKIQLPLVLFEIQVACAPVFEHPVEPLDEFGCWQTPHEAAFGIACRLWAMLGINPLSDFEKKLHGVSRKNFTRVLPVLRRQVSPPPTLKRRKSKLIREIRCATAATVLAYPHKKILLKQSQHTALKCWTAACAVLEVIPAASH